MSYQTDEGDVMLEEICTDILYRIPLAEKFSDWEHSLHFADPLAHYRQRYSKIRFHVSIPDYFLMTTSPTEMSRLVAYLVKMQAGSLDVIVNPETNLGLLYHALMSFQDILPPGKQMSISITDWKNPQELIDQGIIEAVSIVHAFPPIFTQDPIISLGSDSHSNLMRYTTQLLSAGIPNRKLVMAVASTSIAVHPFADTSAVQTLADICSDVQLQSFRPKRIHNDQYSWTNSEKKWSFQTMIGRSIVDQITALRGKAIRGIGLFDVPFKQPSHPICSWHKDLFIQAVHLGLAGHYNLVSNAPVEPSEIIPHWKVIGGQEGGGRLGNILVFADSQEDEEYYINYFRITDDNSLLASPIDHVVLGFNPDGHVYDIYQARCRDEKRLFPYLEYLVNRYSLESVIENAHIYGSLLPPSILIFPKTVNMTSVRQAEPYPQPVPVLITWFKIRQSYPWQIRQSTTTTLRPRSPYYETLHDTSVYSNVLGSFGSFGSNFGERCPYSKVMQLPKRLGNLSISSAKTTSHQDPIRSYPTREPAANIEHPPGMMPESFDRESNLPNANPENVNLAASNELIQLESMLDLLSSLNVSNGTTKINSSEGNSTKQSPTVPSSDPRRPNSTLDNSQSEYGFSASSIRFYE